VIRASFLAAAAVLAAMPAQAAGPLSERTRMVAVEVDRDGARVLGSSLKSRPFPALPEPPAPKEYVEGHPAQIEVVLLGPKGERLTRRTDVPGVCLAHPPETEPHVLGDTIELHRESFVVEVPDLPGYDRVEVAYYDGEGAAVARRALGVSAVEPEEPATLTTGKVFWPERFGDTQTYALYGDPAAVAERINVVIVPDGYTYADKTVMEDHARVLVDYFRAKTPYKEHDAFVNYILVYAYSAESGTDQCDCGVLVDTAMNSRFPAAGFPCGDSGNRCLFYGGGCDIDTSANIAAAELRAPAVDKTIVMVNTIRYGGCGGSRAVYSAGNVVAAEIAGHELGHSLGGLQDEYGGPGCGTSANELNTSSNPVTGAWPEWIPELGPPKPGAQYYDACLYRPETSCEMRTLGPPFCRVCNQRWALTFFGHPRVAATAPMRSASPAPGDLVVDIGFPVSFGVVPRLASGPTITNTITWNVEGEGGPVLASGVTSLEHTFPSPGFYTVTGEIVADTNFVKKEKYGANRDVATWNVSATSFPVPLEVSPPASPDALRFETSGTLVWQERSASGSSAFNLYRGTIAGLVDGLYGTCRASRLPSSMFYLVTGVTSSGEGTMGGSRVNGAPCD
jgi:IgA peptidase M64